ncbi:MAG: hypothetical protein HYX56_02865 [Chloroflexi bacterium]|nr:hypothetical protein [Chloroflexota bacterium]
MKAKTLTRKEFLQILAAASGGVALANADRAQATNFDTVADDPSFRRRGAPQLFGAVGLSLSSHRLVDENVSSVQTMAIPRSGPYVHAWMFGGHVGGAVYGATSIELTLDRLATGYHFVQLYLASIYPYDFWDTTPVSIDGRVGRIRVQRWVDRRGTLRLPPASIQVVATWQGRQVSAFRLDLPDFRAVQMF